MRFGGKWTKQKLEILQKYLDSYTTALKKQQFKLVYIDAFAGTGSISIKEEEVKQYIDGSARVALSISNKKFDELVFVEKKKKKIKKLKELQQEYQDRNIKIKHDDANCYIQKMHRDWSSWRGVLFLDPFGAAVEWSSIKRIAEFKALDMWILFPISAITRMMPERKHPDKYPGWSKKLTRVFGNDDWQTLYSDAPTLDGGISHDTRISGNIATNIVSMYKRQLGKVYGKRLLNESCRLTYNNTPMFELIFCVGNPKGIKPAKRIAKYILEMKYSNEIQPGSLYDYDETGRLNWE